MRAAGDGAVLPRAGEGAAGPPRAPAGQPGLVRGPASLSLAFSRSLWLSLALRPPTMTISLFSSTSTRSRRKGPCFCRTEQTPTETNPDGLLFLFFFFCTQVVRQRPLRGRRRRRGLLSEGPPVLGARRPQQAVGGAGQAFWTEKCARTAGPPREARGGGALLPASSPPRPAAKLLFDRRRAKRSNFYVDIDSDVIITAACRSTPHGVDLQSRKREAGGMGGRVKGGTKPRHCSSRDWESQNVLQFSSPSSFAAMADAYELQVSLARRGGKRRGTPQREGGSGRG